MLCVEYLMDDYLLHCWKEMFREFFCKALYFLCIKEHQSFCRIVSSKITRNRVRNFSVKSLKIRQLHRKM